MTPKGGDAVTDLLGAIHKCLKRLFTRINVLCKIIIMKIMHKGQIDINLKMVKKLIQEQFPQFKNLSISKFNSIGTVNSIYRLGSNYYVRLPMLEQYANDILKERYILNHISKNITTNIPKVIGLGNPDDLYPYHWAIHNWIEGDSYKKIPNSNEIIVELINFIHELHSIDLLINAPKAGRKPLADLHNITIEALNNSKDEINHKKAIHIWESLLNTPVWDNKPVWIHADLLRPNILIKDNHISGIIDFGSAGIGDPAFDIISAWAVFDLKDRRIFRDKLSVDDSIWYRACAYALHQAALIIPYYRKSNKKFVRFAKETINEIIIDN